MICASIAEKDVEVCLKAIEKVEMAEIRIDLTEFNDEEIRKVFSLRKKLIATCRPGKIKDKDRALMLKVAIESGSTYVDIEYEAPEAYKNDLIDFAHSHQCDVIISYHNYEKTPDLEELEHIVQECYTQGADLAKIATHVNVNRDNSKILSLYKAPGRLVAIGMGDLGRISRIVAPFLGAEFTYASLNEAGATAPGQISYEKLSQFILEIQEI
ncbi:MAG: type I 3-dehydroquinate dehydratase [Bacteroidales bacterium]|nr:type I 3-dehydroquinate dehydratase [Bacteroidales bacterium]